LKAEITVLKNMDNKENFEIDDIIHVVDNNILANFYKLLLTALTIPISSTSCERSFSVRYEVNKKLD